VRHGRREKGGRRRGTPARRGEIARKRVAVARGLRIREAAATAFGATFSRACAGVNVTSARVDA